MKKVLLPLCTAAALLYGSHAQAQTRYLNELYTSNDVTLDVGFGFNVDALRSNFSDQAGFANDMNTLNGLIEDGAEIPLNYFQSNSALPSDQQTDVKLFPLVMDIYTPPGADTVSNRPLIVYIHTGNFLPRIINGGPTGSRKDSVVVRSAMQWARKGYVVAALDYRLGWNPISTDPDVRRGTLLQAVYRAIHDTQTCVRFMRSTVAAGNPYGIDPNSIILFGQGSGGYVAQAYATLDNYEEEIAIPKFTAQSGLPYVIPQIDGDIDGGPGAIRLPDPLQQAGISKEVQMSINIGGALADSSWLEAGDAPMVAVHCIRDPFAPFDDGIVVVPTTNENVVEVSGANVFIQNAVDFGNNALFELIPDGNDPYTDRARSLYGQTYEYILPAQPTITVADNPEGLFPVLLPINTLNGNRFTNQGGPWDWWDFNTLQALVTATNQSLGIEGTPNAYDADEIHQSSLLGNPGMGPDKGLAYIDTIQGYVNPRIMCVFGYEGNPCVTGTNDTELEATTQLFPNPSDTYLVVRNPQHIIRRVRLVDLSGRTVREHTVNSNEFRMDKGSLADGIYLVQLTFDHAQTTKKVVFE